MPETARSSSRLREGFTTGSAATAAMAAAAWYLIRGECRDNVSIPVPPLAHDPSIRLSIPVAFVRQKAGDGRGENGHSPCLVSAGVVKDAGDDPDVTNGSLILAEVSDSPLPGRFRVLDNGLCLYAGEGIGTVTLPGLAIPPGEAAINPGPRAQMSRALAEIRSLTGWTAPLHCRISIPDGERLARSTLNSRLGITGGLSILGTGGTVRAYSHDAWKATISGSLDVARAAGLREVALSTGRRSEKLLMAALPDLPVQGFAQAGDFAAFSLALAAQKGFARIHWGCFPGKLVKLAQGLEWTHARSAPSDLDLLDAMVRQNAACRHLSPLLHSMPTAGGRVDLLMREAPDAAEHCLRSLGTLALDHMRHWTSLENRPAPGLDLHVFDLDGRLLLRL